MPKKKMQNGGTFLGPFATQTGQITPRQQFSPGFVPTRTGTTEPTIGLPGQDPIDTGIPISDTGSKTAEIRDRRKKVTQQDQLQQMRAEIDPNVVSGPIDIDSAIAGGAKAGMSREQVLASTPAFQQTLVGYDPNDPRFTDFLGPKGFFQTGMRGVANPKTWVTASLAAATAGAAGVIPALGYAFAKNIQSEEKEDKRSSAPILYTQPKVKQAPSRLTFAEQQKMFRAGEETSMTSLRKLPPPVTTTATFATVGSELFSGDPTYAGGAKTGSDGLYASGGSGSFTSVAHFEAGVSQLDESNIVAEGINSGYFTNAEEGRDFINSSIETGLSESDIVAATESKGGKLSDIEIANQLATPDVDASPKVICAELYRQGLLEKEIFELDEEFGRHLRKVDPDLINGYHQWALPLVSLMQRSIVVSHIIKFIAKPVVKHIAYQMGYPSKTYLGAALFTIGKHICRYIAKKEMAHA